MSIVLKIFGDYIFKALKLFIKLLSYPVKLLIDLFNTYREGDSITCTVKTMWFVLVIFIYSLPIMFFTFNFSLKQLLNIGGATAIIYGNELVEYDGPTSFPGYGNGSTTGDGSFGGGTYKIDLNNLPDNVSLPSNYYQVGTVRQRAELLLLVQEICSRPEIDLTPQELLGILYVECNGNLKVVDSLITTTLPESYNGSGAGGPMQHLKENWWSSDTQVNGKTFISKLEDGSLSDTERVKALNQSDGLKTPDGKDRPNMFYMPDALYSTALRVSENKNGRYRGVKWTLTSEHFDFIDSLLASGKVTEAQEDFLKYGLALQVYSAYVKSCCASWVPALYRDAIIQEGDLAKYSDLSPTRSAMIAEFSGYEKGGLGYGVGGGIVGKLKVSEHKYPIQPDIEYSNYKDYWLTTGERHLPTHYYPFAAINGGTWIYEGLCALGDVVGTKDEGAGGNVGTGGPAGFTGEWVCPLDFDSFVVTSKFHEDRGYAHRGIDIDTGTGDPIRAIQDGTVVRAGWDSACTSTGNYNIGGGIMVFLQFDNGYQARYMHLSELNCKVGDRVKMGDIIGYTGTTGGSTGDHLHLELRKTDSNGEAIEEVDPTFFFKDKITEVWD